MHAGLNDQSILTKISVCSAGIARFVVFLRIGSGMEANGHDLTCMSHEVPDGLAPIAHNRIRFYRTRFLVEHDRNVLGCRERESSAFTTTPSSNIRFLRLDLVLD